MAEAGEICIVCKPAKHPLYLCSSKFRALLHKDMLTTLKEHGLCMNCLGSGDFAKGCKSTRTCRKCHLDPRHPESATLPAPSMTIHSHMTRSVASNDHVLLMTSCLVIRTTDDCVIQARALLDSGSSTTFITECLTQQFHLTHKQRCIASRWYKRHYGLGFSFSGTVVCASSETWQNKLERVSYRITSGNFELPSQSCP